jgi:multiple sugar transport system permease protein
MTACSRCRSRSATRRRGTYGAVNYGLLLAGAVIAMIPCVVVYVSLQRFYVRGLVSGALKG